MSLVNKLVRNKVPHLYALRNNIKADLMVLPPLAHESALFDKLNEEIEELKDSQTRDNVFEEAADIIEIIYSIVMVNNCVERDSAIASIHDKINFKFKKDGSYSDGYWMTLNKDLIKDYHEKGK